MSQKIKKISVAVSSSEMEKWGCPFCGYRSGYMPISAGGSAVWQCGSEDCGMSCCILAEGVSKSTIGFGKTYPKLQEHPRKGIPSHGSPDKKPEGGGEFFNSRGIGLDSCSCFVCGDNESYDQYLSNISAYVSCKDAGERIVKMFELGARLDYRTSEPDYVQVKVGACEKHVSNLEKLHESTNDGIITMNKIGAARKCK